MIERYGAILHKKWTADPLRQHVIIGYWAEDDTPYEIAVPGQLREIILDIQNRLCNLYEGMNYAEAEAVRLKESFVGMFGI